MDEHSNYEERRKRQRFLAQREGKPVFFVIIEGEKLPLLDLSLEGFSIAASAPPEIGSHFRFELRLSDIPDRISGQARRVNFIAAPEGGQLGCRFESFDGDGAFDLHDWLTTHVIWSATVRISEIEAKAIVSGPSMI